MIEGEACALSGVFSAQVYRFVIRVNLMKCRAIGQIFHTGLQIKENEFKAFTLRAAGTTYIHMCCPMLLDG